LPPAFRNLTQSINVPLHKMAAEPIGQPQGPFQVYAVSGDQRPQISALECLRPCLKAGYASRPLDHRQAGPINGYALADCEIHIETWRSNREPLARPVRFNAANSTQGFDQACEHWCVTTVA
jgi:hypothetical protein